MSVDILQEKIRKMKNPSIVDMTVAISDIPPHILEEEGSGSAAYVRFCSELLTALKGIVPAVRFSVSAFVVLGDDGIAALRKLLAEARELGYYVLLTAPDLYSAKTAGILAEGLLGATSQFACDGLVISGYPGSDVIKPFLPYCNEGKKDLFVAVRTANKSAPELQDLLAGSRLVHMAAADHVNRYGGETAGKFGYTRVGVMAAASSAESLRNLRGKYPRLFLLLDGADYPNANAKNCSFAFDKFGHGAVACIGTSVTCAWQADESEGKDFCRQAVAAAERMKKNLTRYIAIL